MTIVGLVVAGGLLFYTGARRSSVHASPDVRANDPVLQRLRATNPMLLIEKRLNDDFNRVPVYWINDPNSTQSIPFPKSEAERDSVLVEFTPCDTATIPMNLQFPGATSMTCVRVTSVRRVLDAFCYRATARLNDVVTHYDGPATGRRLDHRYAEDTGHDGVLRDGTRGFLYSYFLHEGGSGTHFTVDAFIGYRISR